MTTQKTVIYRLFIFILLLSFSVSADLYAQADSTKVHTPKAAAAKTTPADSIKFSDQTLEELEVVGNMPKVQVVEDTLIYNTDAFRLPEGSVLEELIERIPGAEVEDGKVTINGREIKKILVDGKEFFVGDMNTALKNIPTAIISKLKHYDEKSDMAKVTGIDDGEEKPVIDVRIKKGMNKGYNATIDLAYGSHKRYAERVNANEFWEKMKLSVVANANNANDRSTPGRGARGGSNGAGGGSNGLRAAKSAGFNMSYDDKKTLQTDGNIRWNHSNSDNSSRSSAESFVSRTGAFSNSLSQSEGRNNGWNAEYRIEWKPTKDWNIQLRPTASISNNDNLSRSSNASFDQDPYLFVDDPLAMLDAFGLADTVRVNSRINRSMSYGQNRNIGTSVQINRKFGENGRNLTFRGDFSYSDGENRSLSNNNTHYYRLHDALGNDSVRYTNRYNETASRNRNYTLQVTYSEPIFKATFIQFSYRFQYRNNYNDRDTYDFSSLREQFGLGVSDEFRQWDGYLNPITPAWQTFVNDTLSRYSEYRNFIHDFNLNLRIVREKYNLSVGVRYMPQSSRYIQKGYLKRDFDVTRNIYNIAPTMTFRYVFSRQHTLNVDYNGQSQQPSMTQLLDITDDSNPLNISKGNPDLKPSFTNNFRFRYNRYIVATKQSIAANLNLATTLNSISNKVEYDAQSGGRTTTPENINGNWNVNGNFLFTSAIGEATNWNVSTSTDARYNHYVNYITLDRHSSSVENVTHTTTVSERLSGSYRGKWLEVEVNGRVNYTCGRNELQRSANRDTWQYSYGCSFNVKLPWDMTIDTSVNQQSRRGFNDKSFNTNETIWNAQISQSLLSRKRLVLSLQFYDILHQMSNFSRQLSANRRSDTWHNSINSYVMFHAVYNIRNFGGRNGRIGNGGNRGGGGFGGGYGGGYGGGNRGGRM